MDSEETYPDPDQRRLYADLAWLWPLISPPEEYAEEGEEFRHLIHTYAQGNARTVLHLGCGAGHLDNHLKAHHHLVGVDLSAAMLAQARALNPTVNYIQGDMRSIRLAKTFDAAILADSSDYMLTLEDLTAAFQTAYMHLRPGGVFCVYAESTLERFEQNLTLISRHTYAGIDITAIENMYDPDPRDSTYEMTFIYLIRQGGRLSVEVDRHLAGLYSTVDWIDCLESCGFEVIKVEYEAAGPGFIGKKPGQDNTMATGTGRV